MKHILTRGPLLLLCWVGWQSAAYLELLPLNWCTWASTFLKSTGLSFLRGGELAQAQQREASSQAGGTALQHRIARPQKQRALLHVMGETSFRQAVQFAGRDR